MKLINVIFKGHYVHYLWSFAHIAEDFHFSSCILMEALNALKLKDVKGQCDGWQTKDQNFLILFRIAWLNLSWKLSFVDSIILNNYPFYMTRRGER